jgi:hypothetical protein
LSFDANPDVLSDQIASSNGQGWQPEIKVYRLAGLNEWQIRRFAEACETLNVDRFIEDLLDADLHLLGRRPRDLEWLIGYWQEHSAFGSLAEMVEANVCHKLEEQNPAYDRREASLTAGRCREGAEALAAACILCERPLVALPDPELELNPPLRSFPPLQVLGDWTASEIRSLLTKAIFDPATYGRVRFHDPMVRDYLAACWMAERVRAGQRYSRVRRFVIGDAFGETRVVLGKRSVLGWLGLRLPEIRSEVIEIAPDVILYCGDASQISIEERAAALLSLAARIRDIGRTDWTVYDSDIRRLADPRLEQTISELLQTEIDNYETARLLLRIVKLAPMPGCADVILGLAIDDQNSESVRIEAAQTVAAVGTPDQKSTLYSYARTASGLSNRLLGGLCEALFPSTISVDDCLSIARRAAPESLQSTNGIGWRFTFGVVDSCPREWLSELLVGLLDLASTPGNVPLDVEKLR